MDEFYGLLTTYPNTPDLEIGGRGRSVWRPPPFENSDALQAATAERSGATGFVTNDAVFQPIPTFETLLLDGLLESGVWRRAMAPWRQI